jgi:phosphoglycolate phosphatase-like HAD superfamily hydrolase
MESNGRILFAWDFHGVLEKDNEKAVQELCNLVFDELKIDRRITLQEAMDWYGLSWFDYFKLAVPGGDEELWKTMVNKVHSFHERGWEIIQKYVKPKDYAKEVLNRIKSENHHNIIISNSSQESINRFVNAVDLKSHMDEIIGIDSHDFSKINIALHDIKSQILAEFIKDKNYKKIVVIGDRETDIRAGKSVGAITYFFHNQHFNKDIHNIDADFTITDLREVLKELE